MKKILLLNLVFLLFCIIAKAQDPIDVGDLMYSLDTENQTAICKGLTKVAIQANVDLDVEIPSTIKVPDTEDGIEYTVNAIDVVSFSDYYEVEGGEKVISKSVTISIPKTISSLGEEVEGTFVAAFTNCSSLKAINVDKENEYFASLDGVLYSNDFTTLLSYPSAKTSTTVEFSPKVTKIADCAFFACNNLTSVVIPQGVTSIGQNNFTGCSNLTSVIFPKSLSKIADASFTFCDGLTTVISYAKEPADLLNSDYLLVPFSDKTPETAVLIVPNEMVEVYTLKGWGNYFDIQGILELQENKDADDESNILSYTVTGLNSHLSDEQKALIDTVEIPAKFGEIAISEISADALNSVEKVVIKGNTNIFINANNFSNLVIEKNALVYVIGNVNVAELENDGKIIVLEDAVLTDDNNLYPTDENLQLFAQFNTPDAIAKFDAIIQQFQYVDNKTGFSIGFDVKNFDSDENIFTLGEKVIKFDTTSYSIKYQSIADVAKASDNKFTFCYNANGSISCYINGKLAYCLDKQSDLVGQIIAAYKQLTYTPADPEPAPVPAVNEITNIYLSYGNDYLPKENDYYPYTLSYDKIAIRESNDGNIADIDIKTKGLNVTFVLNDLALGTKTIDNPELTDDSPEGTPETIDVDNDLNEVLLATINGQNLNFYEGDAIALVKKINYLTLSLDPKTKTITYYLNGSQVAQKENQEDFFTALADENSFAFATGLKVENVFYAPFILEDTDFEFVEIDGEYWIKGFKEGVFKENIKIPNTYESLDVVGILENAFEDKQIISVTFKEDNTTFREIKDKAFYNNDTIESIIMPAKFQKFAATAFKDCKKFNNFDVSKASAYFVNALDGKIVYSKNRDTLCFVADTTIAELTLDGACHNIADYAMFNCKYISKINLNNTLSIGAHALDSCFSIHTLTIPQNVNEIKDYAFANCWGLWQLVLINPANVNKGDYSNILINEEGNKVNPFIFVPSGDGKFAFVVNQTIFSNLTVFEYDKDNHSKITKGHLAVDCYHLQIPEKLTVNGVESNITTIGEAAFKNANNGKFNSVYLGQNVNTVEAEAFMNTTIEYLAIPWNIKSIGDNAFVGCNSLKEAWYAQTSPISLNDKNSGKEKIPFNILPLGAKSPVLYIPHGTLETYEANNWDDYFFLKYPEHISWQGEVSTEWKDKFNWYADFLPTPDMDVRIDNTFGYPNPEIKNAGLDQVKSIYVAPGHSLTIEANNKLTVKSIVNEGTIVLKSNANADANGSLIVDNYSGNDLIVERYIPEFYNRLSVPFDNVSNYTFTYYNGKITKNFFTYNESAKILEDGDTFSGASADDISRKLADGWVKVSESTDLKRPVYMQVGKGYLFYNKYPRIVSVKGQPKTSLVKSISYTPNDDNPSMDGWNLMGNPFTSAIDLNKVDAPNTDGSVYVFKNDGTTVAGSYDVMQNGLSTSGSGCYVPSMQAFMVRSISNGEIVFPKESRVHNTKEYQKNVRANVLRMSLNNDNQDNLIVYFEDGATDNFDNYKDAYKLSNDNINFYSLNDKEQFAINCLDPKEMLNKKVDLGFSSLNAGEFTISVKDITFDGVDIYLIDKQLNDSINLNLVNSYTFESSQTSCNDRFCLSFSKKAEEEVITLPEDVVMGIEDVDNLEVMVYPIPSNGKVNVSISNFESANYRVFDMMGKLIKADNIISNNQEIIINKSGVYVLELIIDNKQVIKKLIIRK